MRFLRLHQRAPRKPAGPQDAGGAGPAGAREVNGDVTAPEAIEHHDSARAGDTREPDGFIRSAPYLTFPMR